MKAEQMGIRFTDEDVVHPEDFIAEGEYNPHKVRPWLLHDHGFTVAVVFASCEQSALDIAANAGKLDRYQVSGSELDGYPDRERLIFLGNASEPFDTESLGIMELPTPKWSFVALFNTYK